MILLKKWLIGVKQQSLTHFIIIQQNGYGNKINLIPKRSTAVTVGPGKI
jgi:hypothetical protein